MKTVCPYLFVASLLAGCALTNEPRHWSTFRDDLRPGVPASEPFGNSEQLAPMPASRPVVPRGTAERCVVIERASKPERVEVVMNVDKVVLPPDLTYRQAIGEVSGGVQAMLDDMATLRARQEVVINQVRSRSLWQKLLTGVIIIWSVLLALGFLHNWAYNRWFHRVMREMREKRAPVAEAPIDESDLTADDAPVPPPTTPAPSD